MTTIYILTAFVAGMAFSHALSALHRQLNRKSEAEEAAYWADMQKQIGDAPELPVERYIWEVW